MSTIAAWKFALYNWVKNELNDDVPPGQIIWREQSEPLPKRPCVAMKIIDGPRRTGWDHEDFVPESNGDFKISGQREMTLSVQVFGADAHQLASDLNRSLSKETVCAELRKAGIAVFQWGDVQDISAIFETRFEHRFSFDVLLGVKDEVIDRIGIIEEVEYTEEFTDTTGTIPEEEG